MTGILMINPLDLFAPDDAICGFEPDGTPITVGEFRTVLADVARLR
jgi:hypothetical protein